MFIAEGTARDNHLVFSFGSHEVEYIDEIRRITKNLFKVSDNVYAKNTSATQIQFNSKLLSILFRDILKTGSNAITKRIPEIIYSVPMEFKKEFLMAYLDGDGGKVIIEHEGFRPDV